MTNEQAINQLKDMQSRCTNGYDAEVINIAIKALEDRQTGEWIEHYDPEDGFSWLTCSQCNAKAYENDYKYCPQCGAKMKEAEEE